MATNLDNIIRSLFESSGGPGSTLDDIAEAFASRGGGQTGSNLDDLLVAFGDRGGIDAFDFLGPGGSDIEAYRQRRASRDAAEGDDGGTPGAEPPAGGAGGGVVDQLRERERRRRRNAGY